MIGRTISHYRILDKLGEGGMGVVYKAEDTKLDRIVALKFLSPRATGDAEDQDRFIHEAKAAAALGHPNICTIFEIGEHEGQPFIAMECVEGESLRARVRSGPLALDEALGIAIQIAAGLQKAHEKEIVHRDIKSANILITTDGQAKIMDFGLAKSRSRTTLTETGTTLGTVAYMSPEQARGEDVDGRTDIWSLGVVLYEMLSGRLPFPGDHEPAVVYSILNEDPAPLTGLRTGIPMELEGAVGRCLEKDPGERYQTAGDLAAKLRHIRRTLADAPTCTRAATAAKTPERARHRWPAIGIGVAALVVAVLAVWLRPHHLLSPSDTETADERRMLVVLPFHNLGPPEDEYFADGTTDAVTARLAGIRELGVIARQSAIQYKGRAKNIPEIGEELGVEYALEGTIQRERIAEGTTRVRIIPQLIRVSDGVHVWAATYDEDMESVFRLQTEIAEKVAMALDIALFAPDKRAIGGRLTENMEAYDYFLRGNEHFVSRLFQSDTEAGIRMFERAIELDSTFAAAWARLSMTHIWHYWTRYELDAIPKAREAAAVALRLDPDLPETQIALGYLSYYADRDYEKALTYFEEAQAARPSHAEAILAMGWIYRRLGRWDEAIAQAQKALEINPRHYPLLADALGNTFTHLRRYPEAMLYYNRAVSLEPHAAFAYTGMAWVHLLAEGNKEKAGRVIRDALERISMEEWIQEFLAGSLFLITIVPEAHEAMNARLRLADLDLTSRLDSMLCYVARARLAEAAGREVSAKAYYDTSLTRITPLVESSHGLPSSPTLHGIRGLIYAGLGRKNEAIHDGETAAEAVPLALDAMEGASHLEVLSRIYARAGEHEKAIDLIEQLLQVPSYTSIPLYRVDPAWDSLRDNPRFRRLLEEER